MAIGVQRVSGESQVVTNVGDSYTKNANAQIINTGINSPISAIKVVAVTGNLAAELGAPSGAGVPGAGRRNCPQPPVWGRVGRRRGR